jgi:hypothetical protein
MRVEVDASTIFVHPPCGLRTIVIPMLIRHIKAESPFTSLNNEKGNKYSYFGI